METENKTPNTSSDAPSVSSLRWSLRFLFKVVLPIACVVGAVLTAIILVKTGPKAERKKPPQQARQVVVEIVQRGDVPTTVDASGKVFGAREITITPEVSGRITSISPELIPGGLIQKGQELVQIDSRDYEATVKQRESDLASAQLALKLEQGNQVVAVQEYEMLSEIVDDTEKDLVLRKPYLTQARANLASAQAALEKAKLDVRRCRITAPFNAIIQEKFVDVGARVSPTSPVLSIVGTDEFWLEVMVSEDQLKWITIPENNGTDGSEVNVYNSFVWGDGVSRQGTVIRLLGQLEEKGRRAQLLVSVKDPLCLDDASRGEPKLLIDSYVSVEIEGRLLDSVFAVNRDYLHDGDSVWVMNDQSRLEIRPVEIIFRDTDFVYVTDGIEDGQRIVTSEIAAPVDGMLLRLESAMATPSVESDTAKGAQ